MHVALLLAPAVQGLPQPPQFLRSFMVFTSQPLATMLSQFSKPALQVTPHTPEAQVAVALGGMPQLWPQPPQFAVSMVVSMHAPRQQLSWMPPPVLGQSVSPVHASEQA